MAQTLLGFGIIVALAGLFAIPMTTAGKDLSVPLVPGEKERCPVCGMFVSPYPEWVGQVRHDDGTTVFFDGSKDLFKYLLSLDRFAPEKTRRNVAAVFVTNYYDGEVIAATSWGQWALTWFRTVHSKQRRTSRKTTTADEFFALTRSLPPCSEQRYETGGYRDDSTNLHACGFHTAATPETESIARGHNRGARRSGTTTGDD